MSDSLFAIGATVMLLLLLITPTDIQEAEKKETVKAYCEKYPQDLRCNIIKKAGL
jgi:hypothetical protein